MHKRIHSYLFSPPLTIKLCIIVNANQLKNGGVRLEDWLVLSESPCIHRLHGITENKKQTKQTGKLDRDRMKTVMRTCNKIM